MGTMKKTVLASAVALATLGSAQAGQVLFDVNGGAGPNTVGVDQLMIDTFTWKNGNILVHDVVPIGGTAGSSSYVLAQALLATVSGSTDSFSYNSGGGIKGQLTYQLKFDVDYAAGTGTTIDVKPGTGLSGAYFELYYNSSLVANEASTGCGFGANDAATVCAAFPGKLILKGTPTLLNTSNMADTGASTGTPNAQHSAGGLDQATTGGNVDVDNGITTDNIGLGPMDIAIQVTSYDPTFFLTNITQMAISTDPDIVHNESGPVAPFKLMNPWDQVSGYDIVNNLAAVYGNGRNDFACTAATSPCDVHLQSQASTTVLTSPVPEPASLALLGMGLAGLGASLRRRLKRTTA